jgi:hypothetical protein
MSQSVAIGSAVGRQPALNAITDQRAIIGLLNRIHHSQGGPMRPLPPPQRAGIASPELIAAILTFQTRHMEPRFRDSRVDPGGGTLAKLNAMAQAAALETGTAPESVRIEEETSEWVRKALRKSLSGTEEQRLKLGFDYLIGERNQTGPDGKPLNCKVKPLAYAEHYMLTRHFVSQGGDATGLRVALAGAMGISVAGYDLIKLANWAAAQAERVMPDARQMQEYRRWMSAKILELGKCPMSDNLPDPNSIAWGARGIATALRTRSVSENDI